MRILDAFPLQLEPLTAAHARAMFTVLSDPAIYEFENAPPASEDALARRYAYLEGRRSPDGAEQWLNWVVRLADGRLAGYVQATVLSNGAAFVAYELGSRHWRQGIATRAVSAMLDELASQYGVRLFVAVLKSANYRSLGLLRKLAFAPADATQRARFQAGEDEVVMLKGVAPVEEES
ncbi:MAG: GNAT family N-acetyltransferase [Burkholderiales bacterium]